jgi:hypothetical protein
MLKVDRLAACIAPRVVGAELVVFLRRNLHNPSAYVKQGQIPQEMSQPLLTKRIKETWTKYTL